MPRPVLLILVLLAVAGLLVFLSSRAQEVPTQTVEVEVPQGADAK